MTQLLPSSLLQCIQSRSSAPAFRMRGQWLLCASSLRGPTVLRARRSAAACLPRKLARLVAGTQEAPAGGASVASALADMFPRDLAPLIDMSGKRWAHTARRPPQPRRQPRPRPRRASRQRARPAVNSLVCAQMTRSGDSVVWGRL